VTVAECDPGKGRVLLACGVQDIAKQNELIAGLSQGSQISVKIQHVISGASSGVHGLSVLYKDHLEGFIRADDIARSKSLDDYKVGGMVNAIVKSIGHNYKESNPSERFVVLSILAAEKRVSREAHPVRKATFGSMIRDNA
jgi:hypothetical protein